MLVNNFKMAWRHVRKGNIYSFINISGLAIGIACSLTIALYVEDEYGYDRFHQHQRETYRVVQTQEHEGARHTVAATPGLLAEALRRDYPEIIQTCRVSRPLPGILTLKESSIEAAQMIASDNSFFKMFDFRLILGNASKVLLEPNEAVITERIAERLFGKEWRNNSSLLGKQLTINNTSTLTISGVAANCPINSHIQYDVILPMGYEKVRRPENFLHWDNHTYHTYVLLDAEANPTLLDRKIEHYLAPFSQSAKPALQLQPLNEIYLYSNFDYGDWVKTGSVVYIRIFLAVGIAVLLIALFNFVNLSTAQATKRSKEVGVRKVVGALKKQLIIQFLIESFLMTLLSMVLSLLLLRIFVPIMNEISGKSISAPFNLHYGLVMLAGTVLLSIVAGAYPSFLLTSFKPVKVLKGLFSIGSGQAFRRILVVTQFGFSVILILGATVIYSQLKFIQEKDLGFDKEQLIFLRFKNQLFQKAELLKSDLQRETSILGAAATSNSAIDVNASTHSIVWEGKKSDEGFPISHMIVDSDFLPTTGITLLSGRNFDPNLFSDSTSWLINETAAQRMGWTPLEAVGKSLRLWATQGTVVGVVKDFHFRPLTSTIDPMLFRYWNRNPMNYSGLLVRAKPGQVSQAVEAIKRLYKKYETQTIPDYEFVEEALNQKYRTEQNTGRTVLYFSILAVLVSCLGLFGLATFSAAQRGREISIRKVFGASAINLAGMLSKDFTSPVGIALVIALPVGCWAMVHWLETFAYHIDLKWWMILFSAGIVAFVALLTTSFNAIRAVVANPVDLLRSE